MLAPRQLVRRALSGIARSNGAVTLLGQVELGMLLDVPPCWQAMLLALAAPHRLRWRSGPLPVPAWWESAWKHATDDADAAFVRKRIPSLTRDRPEVDAHRNRLIDRFDYDESMHLALISDQNGVSLERISFDSPANAPGSWRSAGPVYCSKRTVSTSISGRSTTIPTTPA